MHRFSAGQETRNTLPDTAPDTSGNRFWSGTASSPDYQVLLVANKDQTGFDQPLLMAMYVDKRLDGVQAVQTLSRLNRMVPGKEEPFVLDFVNEAEDIYKAFKPYYDATSLQETSDPSQLDRLKHELDAMQVYHWNEVEAFARIFYKAPDRQSPADHAHLQRHLQPAVDRFKSLGDDEERGSFRDKLSGYVRVYAFLSQIIPYADSDLEMLCSYGRFLVPHLPLDRESGPVKVDDEVGLHYYRIPLFCGIDTSRHIRRHRATGLPESFQYHCGRQFCLGLGHFRQHGGGWCQGSRQ